MENVTLNQKEQARLQILNSLLSEHMTVDQAATLMGVSTRHIWPHLATSGGLQKGWRSRTRSRPPRSQGSQHNTGGDKG